MSAPLHTSKKRALHLEFAHRHDGHIQESCHERRVASRIALYLEDVHLNLKPYENMHLCFPKQEQTMCLLKPQQQQALFFPP